MGIRIKKGDHVAVISGKHKGRRGNILEIIRDKDRVFIEGVNMVKRHLKPGQDKKHPEGGIITKLGGIHISNVLPIDPQSDKPTRVGYRLEDNQKVRFSKRSGEILN